jgi:hypothetical protein
MQEYADAQYPCQAAFLKALCADNLLVSSHFQIYFEANGHLVAILELTGVVARWWAREGRHNGASSVCTSACSAVHECALVSDLAGVSANLLFADSRVGVSVGCALPARESIRLIALPGANSNGGDTDAVAFFRPLKR